MLGKALPKTLSHQAETSYLSVSVTGHKLLEGISIIVTLHLRPVPRWVFNVFPHVFLKGTNSPLYLSVIQLSKYREEGSEKKRLVLPE